MNKQHLRFCSESHLRYQSLEKGASQNGEWLTSLGSGNEIEIKIPPLFTLWYPGYSKMKVTTSSLYLSLMTLTYSFSKPKWHLTMYSFKNSKGGLLLEKTEIAFCVKKWRKQFKLRCVEPESERALPAFYGSLRGVSLKSTQ